MKTKRLTKLGAVLSVALVLLSGILSVSAASVPQAVIDTDRKASVSLYKYDFTSAHADGVLGDNTYISTGYADENVENTLMPYAIEGVVFSYAKIADLAVHAETKDGEHQNMLLYKLPGGDKTTALINCLDLTSEDAYKTDRGDLYFTSDTLIDALSDHKTLTYEVDKITVTTPDDTDAIQIIDGKDLLTLLTCTPYGTNTHRLLVRGHRIFPDETLSTSSKTSEARPEHTDTAVHRSTWTNEYRNGLTEGLLFALLILLISVFLYGIIRLKAKRS